MAGVHFKSEETYTLNDFLALIEEAFYAKDKQRYELINGRIVTSPPATYGHGESGFLVSVKLGSYILDNDLGTGLDSSAGFILPSGDLVQPDFAFISKDRLSAGPPPDRHQFGQIVPNLVVEILSPSTKKIDLGEKKAIYAKNGVDEYWVLDTDMRRLTAFQMSAQAYGEGKVYQLDELISSSVLRGLHCSVRELCP
jgi:Uma2 family endonuclease